jgi:hypothetical protein
MFATVAAAVVGMRRTVGVVDVTVDSVVRTTLDAAFVAVAVLAETASVLAEAPCCTVAVACATAATAGRAVSTFGAAVGAETGCWAAASVVEVTAAGAGAVTGGA